MRILVTGAAGLIGGELTAHLAAAGYGVIAMVRSRGDICANDGSAVAAIPFAGTAPAAGEVRTISGDVRAPDLGLGEPNLAAVQRAVDMVVHCAAITAFDADPADYQAINVEGTAHLLAAFEGAKFLHVSTAYVCGLKNGAVAEAPRDAAFGFANGYEASKAAAEALVRAAHPAHIIARPSIVVGDSHSGVIRDFDTIYATFRLIAEGRVSMLPAASDAHLDFVPIDHVIGGLIDLIAHYDRVGGGAVHLASGQPVPAGLFARAIGSFAELKAPSLVPPEQFDPAVLPRIEQRLYRRTASLYASYFQRDPRFATDRLRALTGRSCPPVDLAMLQRLIGHCLARGFIRPAAAATSVA
jgi:nucleoside-diphosphate-sugar epimerase